MGLSKITRNNQVTLPKDVREVKNLKEGDTVLFVIEGENVSIKKLNKNSIKEAAGIWKKTKENGLDYEKRIRADWKARLKRETQ